MKVTAHLLEWLHFEFDKKGVTYADLGKMGNTNYQNFQRLLQGRIDEITQVMVDAVCRAFGVTEIQLLEISTGKKTGTAAVSEDSFKYSDCYDRLAGWLRSEATDDGKKAMLMMAQAMGFQDQRLTVVLNALCEPARIRAG